MARGGYRPGAGRPRLSDEEKAERKRLRAAGLLPAAKKAKPKPVAKKRAAKAAPPPPAAPEVPPDVVAEAADANLSPLDYMLKVMRDAASDPQRRDRMAIAAAPFVHARREPVGQGKKEAAEGAAQKAAGGKFGARPAPLKIVGRE